MTGHAPPPNGFRTFVIAWATQSASMIGTTLTFFAVNIWLTQVLYPRPEQKPHLAFALAANGLAFAIPTVILAPIAGAWADRHDRKRTMIVMDLISAVLTFAMIALMVAQRMTLPALLALMTAYALAGAFHSASFDTSYSMLVEPRQLPRANGMMQSIWALSGILAPALAATLISLPALARQGHVSGPLRPVLASLADGTPLALAFDMITFVIAACVLVPLAIPSPRRTDVDASGKARASLWADVGEGARYIWRRRPLLWLLGTFAAVNLVAAPAQVLQPLLVKYALASDWKSRGFTFETALALLATSSGLGGVVGGVAITAWGGLRTRRVLGVVIPLALGGLIEIVYGLSPWLFLTAAAAFCVGMMLPCINAHSQAIWQTQTPHELQGRVFSVRRLVAQGTLPIGTVIGGWMGGVIDPGIAIAILGACGALTGVIQLANPVLRRVEDKQWLDAMAEPSPGSR